MTSEQRPPNARPAFRKLALVVAVVLFVLAAVFQFAAPEQGWFPPVTCLAVGGIMWVIGATGNWPPRR